MVKTKSIQFRLMLIIVIFTVVMLVALVSGLQWVASLTLNERLNHEYQHLADSAQHQLEQRIQDFRFAVRKEAGKSAIVKSVMHSENSKYYIKDYLDAIYMGRLKPLFGVYLFDKSVLFKSSDSVNDLTRISGLDEIDNEVSLMYKYETNGKHMLNICSPILYNGQVEGYLQAMFDWEELCKEYLAAVVESVPDASLKVFYDSTEVYSIESYKGPGFSLESSSNQSQLQIQVSFPEHLVSTPVNAMKKQMVLTGVIIMIACCFSMIFISKRILVKPLFYMHSIVLANREEKWEELIINKSDPTEFTELYQAFNEMIISLKHKTESLKKSNTDLDTANQQLQLNQSQLLQSEKMASIGLLAAGVAHEINNPIGFMNSNLASLKKYVQRLKEFFSFVAEKSGELEGAADQIAAKSKSLKIDYVLEDIDALVDESLEGAERVRTIVRNLKNFSHSESEDMQLADINLNLENTLSIVWNEIKYKAELVKDYGDIPSIWCYAQHLNQVFVNLLVNASHAMREKGVITLKTWSDQQWVYIRVSDNGHGIPADKLSRVFEPFFTTKDVGVGTGLGLSISYDIIQSHNGTIDVESEVGVGTKFTIKLPVETKE